MNRGSRLLLLVIRKLASLLGGMIFGLPLAVVIVRESPFALVETIYLLTEPGAEKDYWLLATEWKLGLVYSFLIAAIASAIWVPTSLIRGENYFVALALGFVVSFLIALWVLWESNRTVETMAQSLLIGGVGAAAGGVVLMIDRFLRAMGGFSNRMDVLGGRLP